MESMPFVVIVAAFAALVGATNLPLRGARASSALIAAVLFLIVLPWTMSRTVAKPQELFGVLSEFTVAWVIYHEIGQARLERFLEIIDGDSAVRCRRKLYRCFADFVCER